jgi:hypothetical protein
MIRGTIETQDGPRVRDMGFDAAEIYSPELFSGGWRFRPPNAGSRIPGSSRAVI